MFKNTCATIKYFIKDDDNRMWLLITLLLAAVVFFATRVVKIYSSAFGTLTFPTTATPSNLPSIRAEWGQIGDFFGGILNPLFGFASLFALLVTIAYQARSLRVSSEELKLSREELSKSSSALAAQNKAIELQSFEQTFFSWLNTYRNLLNAVSTNNNSSMKNAVGTSELYNLWNNSLADHSILSSMSDYQVIGGGSNLKDEFISNYPANFSTYSNYKQIEIISEHLPDATVHQILKLWSMLYHTNEYQLDGLFRVIYRLILWIDSQDNNRVSLAQKWLYVSIIRSQFSRIEMIYLFYNGLTGVGEKFKHLIEKYALFDNLTFDSDIGIKTIRKYLAPQKFYLEVAFNSELAREKLGLPKSSEQTLALATTTSHSS